MKKVMQFPATDKEGDKTKDMNEEDDRVKCNECDFKTRVRTYMKSHKMAHEGQYQCQRDCKEKFKTFSILDDHNKIKHTSNKKQTLEFKCNVCNSQHHLRQHVDIKHARQNISQQANCEWCGLIVINQAELRKHIETCTEGFQQNANKVCRFFCIISTF